MLRKLAPLFASRRSPASLVVAARCSSSFTWRTHTCGDLRKGDVDKEVVLCGWLQYKRLNKFFTLRDGYGATQVRLPDHKRALHIDDIPLESVLQVSGTVKERPPDQHNPAMATGDVEVEASDVRVLNPCKPNLPFTIRDFHKVKEPLRLQYRYLDLRNARLQENLRLRSAFIMKLREYLCKEQGFVDVETPTLFRRTPGGAREFLVPSQFSGKFYVLTQSPQQFKQLLMVGAIDRYFQVARCYRDESTLPDRQPEFTQLDIEMSFTDAKGIQSLVEQTLLHAWPSDKGSVRVPFPRMTYQEAMAKYGTDKPDTRFGVLLQDVTDVLKGKGIAVLDRNLTNDADTSIQCIIIPEAGGKVHTPVVKPVLDRYRELCLQQYGLPGFADVRIQSDLKWQSVIKKHLPEDVQLALNKCLNLKPSDLIILCSGRTRNVRKLLGKLRCEVVNVVSKNGVKMFEPDALNFLWVTDFPLFLEKDEGTGIESAHHPFTAPHPDDVHLVMSDPLKVRGQHYDLVLNGQEIAGGSIRIHNTSLQRSILRDILKEDVSTLGHLLDALESGCPPHGGIALGLDRLVSILCGSDGIRDVIAFPKSLDGKDLMSGAPAEVSDEDKAVYHIRTVD